MLEQIGYAEADAAERIERFRVFDEQLLREQHLVYDDESALMQSAAQARKDLEGLFEAGSSSFGER